MNDEQKHQHRARMAVAQLFRYFLNNNAERARLMGRLGVDLMPVIVPALGDTSASVVREVARRYFEKGEKHILVPVGLQGSGIKDIKLCVLVISTHSAKTLWQLDMNELHDDLDMAQVVEALDAHKKWNVEELNFHQQELKDLIVSA